MLLNLHENSKYSLCSPSQIVCTILVLFYVFVMNIILYELLKIDAYTFQGEDIFRCLCYHSGWHFQSNAKMRIIAGGEYFTRSQVVAAILSYTLFSTGSLQVKVPTQLHHPHLVLLVGACPGNGCLVYEYLENRCLEESIFCRNGKQSLSWFVRFV